MDHIVCKYQETSLSTIECFYFPGDAEDVANYGQELIDWISDIRKHLIKLKAETMKILRDKEKGQELAKASPFPDFLAYEQRLKNIYHSVVNFEQSLKIKPKPVLLPLSNLRQALVLPSPSGVQPDTERISRPGLSDDATLTERLDKVSLNIESLNSLICFPQSINPSILSSQVRNTLTAFQSSRPEFSTNLFQIHQKYHLESFRPPLSSSRISNAIYQTVDNITSESLPHLLSTAKAGCQEVLAQNEKTFHIHLEQQLHASFGLIQVVLGVANAALYSVPEEGEILD